MSYKNGCVFLNLAFLFGGKTKLSKFVMKKEGRQTTDSLTTVWWLGCSRWVWGFQVGVTAVSFPHIPHVTACSRVDQSLFLELLCFLWSLGKVLEPGECLIHQTPL